MISDNSIVQTSLMLTALYILFEVVFYFGYRHVHRVSTISSDMGDQEVRVVRWKNELARHGAKGAMAVDVWIPGWFVSLDAKSAHLARTRIEEVKRGNVEEYICVRILGLGLKEVLNDSTAHHVLIGLVSELERKRSVRFPSGTNHDLGVRSRDRDSARGIYQPLTLYLFVTFIAALRKAFLYTSKAWSIIAVTISIDQSPPAACGKEINIKAHTGTTLPEPHLNVATRAIPASSLAMVSSLSNLSSIGLCSAPPLRTRQRSRTIDGVITCAQIPVSSLAMMSSLSNLSSIGMCAAPPLRMRQRSRTATLVVGYASAVPFALTSTGNCAA